MFVVVEWYFYGWCFSQVGNEKKYYSLVDDVTHTIVWIMKQSRHFEIFFLSHIFSADVETFSRLIMAKFSWIYKHWMVNFII